MQSLLLQNEKQFLIAGPAGQLELAISIAPVETDRIAVICHPHPLYGGTMFNKVVTTLAKTYQALNFITIRFNFRGVGLSEGHYGDGMSELDDLVSVIQFAKEEFDVKQLFLAGFSFGAYIATKAENIENVAHLVTVAPAVSNFPMDNLNPACPWILIQGDQDEIIAASEVYAYANSRKNPPEIITLPDATHFFHGQLKQLQESLRTKLMLVISP